MARRNRKPKTKILASASTVPEPRLPVEQTKKSDFRGKWVLFFKNDNNSFPNDTALRALRSPTCQSIIESKLVYTTGNGFTAYRRSSGDELDMSKESSFNDYIQNVNSNGESLMDVYGKCARDLITVGNFSLEIARTGDRLNIFHKDATTVRLEHKDAKGLINNAYISYDWQDIKNREMGGYEDKIITLPTFKKGSKDKNSLLYIPDYSPMMRYYGLPDHIASANFQEIEYRIGSYNLTRFANGFFPSAIVDLFGEPPDNQNPKQYIDSIVKSFTGDGNNSKVLFQLLDSPDQKSAVQLFEGAKDGDFISLQKIARESIIQSHRYTPSLAGLATSGTLGSNQQMMTEFEIVNNTVIKGYKHKLLQAMNYLIEEAGFGDFYLEVFTAMPVSYASSIKPEQVLTINEQRNLIGFKGIDDMEGEFVNETKTE